MRDMHDTLIYIQSCSVFWFHCSNCKKCRKRHFIRADGYKW